MTVLIASPIFFSSLSFVLASLALSSTMFIPDSFARSVTMVVFPVPGGPTSSIAFFPGLHSFSQRATTILPSSLPTISEMVFGLYFSTHNLEGSADEDDEAY